MYPEFCRARLFVGKAIGFVPGLYNSPGAIGFVPASNEGSSVLAESMVDVVGVAARSYM
jgi:hypothetical protein